MDIASITTKTWHLDLDDKEMIALRRLVTLGSEQVTLLPGGWSEFNETERLVSEEILNTH